MTPRVWHSRRVSTRPAIFTTMLAALVLTSCGFDQGVANVASDQTTATTTPIATTPVDPSSEPSSEPDAPDTTTANTTPETMPPGSTIAPEAESQLLVDIPIGDVVDVDANKPARDYDAFVAVAFTDIERWWNEVYPTVYGEPFEPLAGGIYAGYPERQTPLPGCGQAETTYQDLNQFVAFYCQEPDFMMYDDGDESLLAPLTSEFGPAVMGIVLAHEYGHAIQSRIGALDQFVATIYTEQQADCFSGAWAGQAYRGESPMIRLSDADVRAGLIAMLEVRDPVGTNQFVEGGHGSAFDRVGAFQEGFVSGPSRCAELLENPLILMPNEFQPLSLDAALGGNAPYDCEELRDLPGATDEIIDDCTPAPVFLADDLNDYWAVELGEEFPVLNPVAVDDVDGYECSDGVRLEQELVLCPSLATVAYSEPEVLDLYRNFGDFTLGYFYGIAWAERAQEYEGSQLTGEARALLNDCYTGAWVADITPDATGATERRRDTDGDGVDDKGVITSSAGDLDEAIRMAILVGDAGATVDLVGSPFEKIESFRAGVLGGLDVCNARFAG